MAGQRIGLKSALIVASLFFWPLCAEESVNDMPENEAEQIVGEIGAELSAGSDIEALPEGHYIEDMVADNLPEERAPMGAKKAEEKVLERAPESVVIVEEQERPVEPHAMLAKGTYFVQGAMSIIYKLTGFSYMQHTLCLNGKAGVGYFINDRLAVGANIPSSLKFFPLMMGEIGLSPFSTYFFDIGRAIYPYVGIDITPRYSLQERNFLLSAGMNAGLLVSLSERVALDFGIEPELYFRLNNQQKWKIEVPIGFFGIKAFF